MTTTLQDDAGPHGPGTPGAEDTCLVSITGPGTVAEGGTAAGYTVTLSQPAVTDVVIRLNYGGSASAGSDYAPVLSVTIPAGSRSASFDLPTSPTGAPRAARASSSRWAAFPAAASRCCAATRAPSRSPP